MASISNSLPACAVAEESRESTQTAAMAERTPMCTKSVKSTRLGLMPERMAALRFPPTAYTWRPNTVRVRMKL